MKKIILASILTMAGQSYAATAIFDIEIGVSTRNDIKSSHRTRSAGISKLTDEEMLDLYPEEIDFDGVQRARVVFDSEAKVQAVVVTLANKKFRYLFDVLSKKYELKTKHSPFVGDKEAEFVDGDVTITVNEPHMSFSTTLIYASNNLASKNETLIQSERKSKKKKQASML